jgi:hypothetical protein
MEREERPGWTKSKSKDPWRKNRVFLSSFWCASAAVARLKETTAAKRKESEAAFVRLIGILVSL